LADYEINYDDERFKQVESDKKNAISDIEKTYSGMIDKSDAYYQQQIDASKEWEKKQTEIQNQQTDFAIDKIEQEKAQAKKDYTKEQSGAYVDWQKQSNEYGANAEAQASMGMQNTGYSESSQVSYYNTYQNRVATARESFNQIVMDFNNQMTEARLQNSSVLAQIAAEAQQKRLELALQGFQYKNQLILDQTSKKLEVENQYYKRYQDVLAQINTENALAEKIRQYNESLALEKEQFEWQKEQTAAKSSRSSGGGSSSSNKSSSNSSNNSSNNAQINKTSGSSSNQAPVNLKSVVASGLGPASGTHIANAVKSGTHTAMQIGKQVYIAPKKTNKTDNSVTKNLLYSLSRF
jgi:hypothetical protein